MSKKEYSNRHLAHLDQAQVVELMRRYYDGEKVSLLVAEYRLDCPQGKLYSLFPPETLDDQRCPTCGGVMILPRVSRTYGARSVRPKCAECRHIEAPNCPCAHCVKLRTEAATEKAKYVRESIEAYCHGWHAAQRTIMPADLPLDVAVALVSLVRACGWKSEGILHTLYDAKVRLAPHNLLTDQLQLLRANGLIAPEPDSDAEAFRLENGQVVNLYYELINWRVSHESPVAFVQAVEELAAAGPWPEEWRLGIKPLRFMLANAECAEFTRYCLDERRMPEPGAVAASDLYDSLLRRFSVSQCYQVIHINAGKASDFLVRRAGTKQHAANYFVGACRRWADHAIAEGWTVKGYHRNFNLPRSQASHTLYDLFLKIGDRGFTSSIDADTEFPHIFGSD